MGATYLLSVLNCSVLMSCRVKSRGKDTCVFCFNPMTCISTCIIFLQLFSRLGELGGFIVSRKYTSDPWAEHLRQVCSVYANTLRCSNVCTSMKHHGLGTTSSRAMLTVLWGVGSK